MKPCSSPFPLVFPGGCVVSKVSCFRIWLSNRPQKDRALFYVLFAFDIEGTIYTSEP